MTSHEKCCPACGGRSVEHALSQKSVPAFLFPVAADALETIEAGTIDLSICSDCGHMFRDEFDEYLIDKIYKDYYKYYPYDSNEVMSASYRSPFFRFFEMVFARFESRSRIRMLEIGCSKPINMKPFADRGIHCIGIDPSPLAVKNENFPNIEVISGYYESEIFEEKFDIIISRFNMEHIKDVSLYAAKIKEDLHEGGRIILQIPNLDYYISKKQPFFVAHEHLHYFTPHSVRSLFEGHGFRLVASYHLDEPSILICFEKQDSIKFRRISKKELDSYKSDIIRKTRELEGFLRGKRKIVCYGCGLSLYWVLDSVKEMDLLKISIIDDNKELVGRKIPVYGLTVNSSDSVNFCDVEIVILTLNPIYHAGVIEKLNNLCNMVPILKIGDGVLELEH